MPRNIYYLASFLAGGSLMACELLVAKLIAPYYGASLYVWAATIGTTLIGLAAGYFYSGELAKKSNQHKILFRITVATALYILILPFFARLIMQLFMPLHVMSGILLSTLVFNMPLFFLFGLFSPVIIHLLNEDPERSGAYAGLVYGISTLSGVLFLVLTGVYALPSIGIQATFYVLGALMVLLSGITFVTQKKIG